jgi:hypothetical protein
VQDWLREDGIASAREEGWQDSIQSHAQSHGLAAGGLGCHKRLDDFERAKSRRRTG